RRTGSALLLVHPRGGRALRADETTFAGARSVRGGRGTRGRHAAHRGSRGRQLAQPPAGGVRRDTRAAAGRARQDAAGAPRRLPRRCTPAAATTGRDGGSGWGAGAVGRHARTSPGTVPGTRSLRSPG